MVACTFADGEGVLRQVAMSISTGMVRWRPAMRLKVGLGETLGWRRTMARVQAAWLKVASMMAEARRLGETVQRAQALMVAHNLALVGLPDGRGTETATVWTGIIHPMV